MHLVDLLADAAIFERTPVGARCTFEVIFEQLSPKEAEALKAAVDNRAITNARLSEVLFKAGHNVKPGTVSRHRSRGMANGCRCPK